MNCRNNPQIVCKHDWYCENYQCDAEKNPNLYSISEDLTVSPCKYTTDGYCLRNEGDYCPDGQCNCPHWIAEIKVIHSCVTCETTVQVCEACNEILTEPKTDC